MKYLSTAFFFCISIALFGQVSTYPDFGIFIGSDNPSFTTTKPNSVRMYSESSSEVYDFAVNDMGQLVFYRNGQFLPLLLLNDNFAEVTIMGEENNGTRAGLRIESGAQTMIMDGNEIDAFADELNLNFNTSEAVTIANGGGGVSINRAGSPADNVDIHLKQSGGGNASGGLAFEEVSGTDRWKIYHSGVNISFSEKKAGDASYDRQAYISSGTGAYVQDSDVRLKENIVVFNSDVMDKIQKLKLKQYNYKVQSGAARTTTGFIAQEVQVLFPDMVYTSEEGTLGLAYSEFGVLAIRGLQEINTQMSIENKKLKDELQSLAARIEKLESK